MIFPREDDAPVYRVELYFVVYSNNNMPTGNIAIIQNGNEIIAPDKVGILCLELIGLATAIAQIVRGVIRAKIPLIMN